MQTNVHATPITSRQVTEIGLLLDRLGKRRTMLTAARLAGLREEPRTAAEAATVSRCLNDILAAPEDDDEPRGRVCNWDGRSVRVPAGNC